MNIGLYKFAAVLSLLVLPATLTSSAFATVLSITAGVEFSGGAAPVGDPPWLTAVLDDQDGTGSVIMTLTATNLTDREFVSKWYLNLDSSLDPENLVFSAPTKVGDFDTPSISLGTNDFKAAGGGKYDIAFQFATAGGDSRRFDKEDIPVIV